MNKINTIDLSKPKRRYYNNTRALTICPECGSDLIEENCTILLSAKSDSDEGKFMTNLSGSHFCVKCPVVVQNDPCLCGSGKKYKKCCGK